MKLAGFVVIAAAAYVAQASAGLPPPEWPAVWKQDFTETEILAKNNGTYWYDSINQRARTDRRNGASDRYCGAVRHDKDLQCNQIVLNGTRWLVWPEIEACCAVCGAAQGCGFVRRDWLINTNASYVGQKTFKVNGQSYLANGWNSQGLQANYWWQTADGGIPLQLKQVPNDNQIFDPATYTTSFDESVFDLPPFCKGKGSCL